MKKTNIKGGSILKKMKLKKTVGLDGIPIKVCRFLRAIVVTWLTNVFNRI